MAPNENPFFLHSFDHAGMSIVSDRLSSGADFYSWRRSVQVALNFRNKLGFIDGTLKKPADDHRDFGTWSRCNDIVSTWIINSVDKKIGASLLFIPTAEGIWKNLMSRFKQDDAPHIFEIEQKLNSIQQGSLDVTSYYVTSYYTLLVTLWEEYKNYAELPVCTCGKCECNAAALWEKLQERSQVTKFLMGLNESYASTRRHILMLKPIPSIEEAFNMVTSDKRQRSIKPKPDTMIFQTSAPTQDNVVYLAPFDNVTFAAIQNTYHPRGSRPLCTHCGQTGHVVQKCFKLHGYPPGYIPGFKSTFANYQAANQQRASAPGNQFRGHSPNPRPPVHTVANVVTKTSSHLQSAPAAASNLDVSTLTGDQIQTLIQQLNAQVKPLDGPVSSSQVSSIKEHGAMAIQSSSGNPLTFPTRFSSSSLRFENNCLTFQHQCLSSLSKHIPHGSWIIDTGATSHVCSDLTFFSETVTISSVTVSLPNEAKESIQDLMIGKDYLLHNLYVLHLDSSPAIIPELLASASPAHFTGSLEVDGHLWHQRLGHPSPDKLKLLTASSPFDLVHLDIWGPFSVESIEGYRYFLTIVDDL
ncbi:PREDICTED: uncharacterized protein LOC104759556 [Camelina sativa]|uniref:Uncharacterized protein LOC104759556 n=1 Tax=Camelina sativa TaxID=90675 RepID=A0ABM0X4Y7_CAMSA|nr:PREDICTED: uncharacterized protein LOC104759556 [Camelina sativa]